MGMGTYGCHGYVISLEELTKLCPETVKQVEAYPDFNGWGSVAENVEDNPAELANLVDALIEDFNKKTGLELSIDYYDTVTAERYDVVDHSDGCVFTVQGMTMLTPAGEKFKHIINEQSWTGWG